ncbi:hypothetical protein F5B21DRAFT_378890 [Xylaria acuta]|nr:hypothetical protein F5B21DRAFT_378890 [Xylaria acuta]
MRWPLRARHVRRGVWSAPIGCTSNPSAVLAACFPFSLCPLPSALSLSTLFRVRFPRWAGGGKAHLLGRLTKKFLGAKTETAPDREVLGRARKIAPIRRRDHRPSSSRALVASRVS